MKTSFIGHNGGDLAVHSRSHRNGSRKGYLSSTPSCSSHSPTSPIPHTASERRLRPSASSCAASTHRLLRQQPAVFSTVKEKFSGHSNSRLRSVSSKNTLFWGVTLDSTSYWTIIPPYHSGKQFSHQYVFNQLQQTRSIS